MKRIANNIPLQNIKIQDGFWSRYQTLVNDVVIPYQLAVLDDKEPTAEKSHAIENFRIAAGISNDEYYGMVFQDSDLAKWIEAAAYSLALKQNPKLESEVDEIIDIIGRAQQLDGYLNTYFTVKAPDRRWGSLHDCHELYCAGHMIEAAVAYYEVTGKKNLLHIMQRMADHIDARFGKGKVRGIPGHEEIELALLRLYRATGEERYLNLAEYFLNERGTEPSYFAEEIKSRNWTFYGRESDDPQYAQSHAPVREQSDAVGHSVRAMYLYTGMADLVGETGDSAMFDACIRLWDSTVNRQMYITGGIGSTAHGEAFTIDYDLPNDTIYAETCASIGLVFFAKKMLELSPNNRYGDVMERALYNGIMSGMELDGRHFFYVNPLEVVPGVSGELAGFRHVKPQRPQWYGCACCPPNVARLVTSLGQYIWSESQDTIYNHLFIGNTVDLKHANIEVTTNYPWDGDVTYKIMPKDENERFTLAIRIPAWCKGAKLTVNDQAIDLSQITKDGYAYIKRQWNVNDTVKLILPLEVKRIYANATVRADSGCVALMRGPIVYCVEEVDNISQLQALRIPRYAAITALPFEEQLVGGVVPLAIDGLKISTSNELYSDEPPKEEPLKITAIPYYAWGNRGKGAMRVWMIEKQ